MLTEIEVNITRDLLIKGYQKAAKAFSSITQQQVFLRDTTLVNLDKFSVDSLEIDTPEFSIITTKMVGDLSGESYLILQDAECEELFKLCLPNRQTMEASKRIIMEEAVLKEVDNILSATVITEFSNQLGVSIYGDVPVLERCTADNLNRMFQSSEQLQPETDWFLFSDAQFHFESNTSINPHFFWKLTSSFQHYIKEYAATI